MPAESGQTIQKLAKDEKLMFINSDSIDKLDLKRNLTVVYELQTFKVYAVEFKYFTKFEHETISEALRRIGVYGECFTVKFIFDGWPIWVNLNFKKELLDHPESK